MTKQELEEKLLEKTRPELQVIAKNKGVRNHSKATKKELAKNILSKSTERELRKELGLKKKRNFFATPLFIITTAIIIPTIYFIASPSKKEVVEIVNSRFELYEKKTLQLDEYISKIEELSDLYKVLLEQLFTGGYKVYGSREGKFISIDSYDNKNIRNKFDSRIKFNKEKNTASIRLDLNDVRLPKDGIINGGRVSYSIINGININLTGKGQLIYLTSLSQFSGINMNECYVEQKGRLEKPDFGLCYYFVLLNNDINNPVFAIGLARC